MSDWLKNMYFFAAGSLISEPKIKNISNIEN